MALNANYLIAAGAGGGGYDGGGGGAGGLKTGTMILAAGTYPAVVGAGGNKGTNVAADGSNGSDSSFNGVTATGGGAGGGNTARGGTGTGKNGGSGGGGATDGATNRAGGTGTAGQGSNGGATGSTVSPFPGGGGGGASAVGADGAAGGAGGKGGDGTASSITGSSVTYCGGGGAGNFSGGGSAGAGGAGGGGAGAVGAGTATNGTANSGGGGGACGDGGTPGNGGSGTVILSFLTSDLTGWTVTGGAQTTSGANTIVTFNSSASLVLTAPAAPVADFTGTPTSGTTPLSVTFTDASTNTPTSWLWERTSDGTNWTSFSTSQNPTQSFTTGTWGVRLTATNAGGSNTKTSLAYITVAALAGGTPTIISFATRGVDWAEVERIKLEKALARKKVELKKVAKKIKAAEKKVEVPDPPRGILANLHLLEQKEAKLQVEIAELAITIEGMVDFLSKLEFEDDDEDDDWLHLI